jgi:hypothetical protein
VAALPLRRAAEEARLAEEDRLHAELEELFLDEPEVRGLGGMWRSRGAPPSLGLTAMVPAGKVDVGGW